MKIPSVLFLCLLPYAAVADFDESSTRKINLEDIEDDHIKNERQSMPPPLSKQPVKGQPVQLLTYPPLSSEEAYPILNRFDTHHYSTRAHQHAHVQPLTDQPTAPATEAGYQNQNQQQSTAYHGEQIVYMSANGQQSHYNPQKMYDVAQPQPQPQLPQQIYYSHDLPQQQSSGNENENHQYQIQLFPIGQHGGSDEQHSFHGPSSQVTVPSIVAPVEPVTYSHDGMPYDEVSQPETQQHPQQQPHDSVQYIIDNGLLPDVLFQSQKDIKYAKPTENYGSSPKNYFKKNEYSQRDYSQDLTPPKPIAVSQPTYQPKIDYSDQIKTIEYQKQPSQLDSSPSNLQTPYHQKSKTQESAFRNGYENQLGHQNVFKYNQIAEDNKKQAISESYANFPASLAPSETQTYYLNHLKDIKSVHSTENVQKPAIIYGPPETAEKDILIEYSVTDAPFRRPVVQSNQDIYAPRRESSSGRSYGKSFAVSFPYPPSFVSITEEKTSSEKSTTTAEQLSNNDVNPWRPINVRSSTENQYRSFGQTPDSTEDQQSRQIDFFHTRRAKSLLDSYIPSWLVTRMQEEHARQGHQPEGQVKQEQSYTITSPQTEDSYNTISYSSHENNYGKHFKRSVPKKKGHPKKKVSTSNEEMTAME